MLKLVVNDSIQVQPDTAKFTFLVDYFNKNKSDCQTKGTEFTLGLVESLENLGVVTSRGSIYVSEVCDFIEDHSDESRVMRKKVRTGYNFKTSISFEVTKDFDMIPLVDFIENLDDCCKVSVNYYRSDLSDIEDNLVVSMIKEARRKANLVANASGREVIGVKEISYEVDSGCYQSESFMRCASNGVVERAKLYDISSANPQIISDSISVIFNLK